MILVFIKTYEMNDFFFIIPFSIILYIFTLAFKFIIYFLAIIEIIRIKRIYINYIYLHKCMKNFFKAKI